MPEITPGEEPTPTLDLMLRAETDAATAADMADIFLQSKLDEIVAKGKIRDRQVQKKKYEDAQFAHYLKLAKKTLKKIQQACEVATKHDWVGVEIRGGQLRKCRHCDYVEWTGVPGRGQYVQDQILNFARKLQKKDLEAGVILLFEETH